VSSILVVDDDVSLVRLLVHMLEHEGHHAEAATSVPEALAKLTRSAYQLVLVDYFLPPSTALQLLHQLPDGDRRPRVVVISGLATPEQAAEVMAAGATQFIQKPIRREGLAALLGVQHPIGEAHHGGAVVTPGAVHVRMALRLIAGRFGEKDFKMNAAARALRISPGHLSRLIRRHTGRGFGDHLHERRVAEARALLEHTDFKVADVAWSSGYHTIKELDEHFLKHCHCLPSEYRTSKRNPGT
jgi:two-component system, response regulator YesN